MQHKNQTPITLKLFITANILFLIYFYGLITFTLMFSFQCSLFVGFITVFGELFIAYKMSIVILTDILNKINTQKEDKQ
jgi:hypothetical protein